MASVSSLGEMRLIERFARHISRPRDVRVGIGDDTAVIRWPSGQALLFASDMLVEGVHFRLAATAGRAAARRGQGRLAPYWIGWKALACNISDVAAMGGEPAYAVVSLGVPPATPIRVVDELYRGLRACAARFSMAIVGGDTVRAPQLVVDVGIIGRAHPAQIVRRSGARVGDLIYVTGRLGGSLASGKHARFLPRVREAQWLVRHVRVRAMMDLSDGLASDLGQMARAGRVRLRVEEALIPVASAAGSARQALMDGEDFELLFVVSPAEAPRLPARVGNVPLTRIGTVAARGAGVELVQRNGHIVPLTPTGFKHF